jgi:hypothetical protein
MSDDDTMRLKALWKSGRDSSFFQVLNGVRKRVGDDALPHWCIDNLHIGMSVSAAKTLQKLDSKLKIEEFAAAKRAANRRDDADVLRDEVTRLKARVRELESKLAEAERAPIKSEPKPTSSGAKPARDRRDYMREFMRRKRAAK